MTWQQEIGIAVYRERQRANEIQKQADAEKVRADEAEARADEVERLANAEKARADRYEKMLRELGKL